MKEWETLDAYGTARRRRWPQHIALQGRREAFQSLVLGYRSRLERLFASETDTQALAAGKTRIYAELDGACRDLKRSWGGVQGYDRWLGVNANMRASLASIAVYAQWSAGVRVDSGSVRR